MCAAMCAHTGIGSISFQTVTAFCVRQCNNLTMKFTALYYRTMPKRKNEISREDCPDWVASAFPGKFDKNNSNGTLMSRQEWKEDQVRRWCEHFSDNPKYENSSLASKVLYLVPHLKILKVKPGEARALLVKVESDVEGGGDHIEVEVGGEDHIEEEGDGEDHIGEEGGGEDHMEVEGDGEDPIEEGDMGEDMEVDEESDKENDEESRGRVDLEVKRYMDMTDQELFEEHLVIPVCVLNSRKFKARKREFIRQYMERSEWTSSQEILENLSQAPSAVQPTLKESVVHLTKREKATRLILKTLSDTIKRLRETGGQEARKQVQIITAAISHHQ